MEFPAVLQEVARLNSWARVREWGVPKYAIYWLKGEAIKKAISLEMCFHKKVFVLTKCRDCGGSGRYETSYGEKLDHCRACNSSGVVRLRFVETVIQADGLQQIWHTPWDRASFGHGLSWEGAWLEPCKDWTVNKPGQALSPIEAAEALNTIEVYFNARPGVCTWYPNSDDFGLGSPIDNLDYHLYLGTKPRICSICGESKEDQMPYGYGASKGKLSWTDFACKACDQKAGGNKSIAIWKRFEPPEIAKDPEIRVWEARHEAWFPKKG